MPQVPLLIFVGSDDPLGGEASVLYLANDYIRRSGQNDVTVTVYPEGRHEMFNETNKEQVIDDVLSWITERTKD
jgi:alpha-beta hydrolase superfamily lysophospholipase